MDSEVSIDNLRRLIRRRFQEMDSDVPKDELRRLSEVLSKKAKTTKTIALEEGGPVIGIDIGTTYACIAVWDGNLIKVIAKMPCFVAFTQTERLIGDAAWKQFPTDFGNVIYFARRFIGTAFSNATARWRKPWPFMVSAGPRDELIIKVRYKGDVKEFSAEQICSLVLMRLHMIAEEYLGCTVKNAVVTVPATFNETQRQATKDAVMMAGFDVIHIDAEPCAAALAYRLDKQKNSTVEKNVLICDAGGFSFRVSLLTVGMGNCSVINHVVKEYTGGDMMVIRMVNHFVEEIKMKHNIDIGPEARRRLKVSCERAKRILSFSTLATIEVNSLTDAIDFYSNITRTKFEELNLEIFNGLIETVDRCLKKVEIDKSSVHDVVLAGGSSKIPKIQELLKDYFDGKVLLRNSINPDHVIAIGAAVQGAELSGEDLSWKTEDQLLLDVTKQNEQDPNATVATLPLARFTALESRVNAIFEAVSWIRRT